MKTLVIDAHKSSNEGPQQNLHWLNSKRIADKLQADLIWSYPNVNANIVGGYDKVVFVHASPYANTDYAWLEASPEADLYYVSNEYNLGEPRTLWMAVKAGRTYQVIANHPPEPSKIVKKYTSRWHNVNLNALIYRRWTPKANALWSRSGCIYYGSFRKNRACYFRQYLSAPVVLSTHPDNVAKFREAGATSDALGRIRWPNDGDGLSAWSASLYLEDTVTHCHYNHLANRFYEALNHDCVPLFTKETERTIDISGYRVPSMLMVASTKDIANALEAIKGFEIPSEWHERAELERADALEDIEAIVSGDSACSES